MRQVNVQSVAAVLGIIAALFGIVAAIVTIVSVWASRRAFVSSPPVNGSAPGGTRMHWMRRTTLIVSIMAIVGFVVGVAILSWVSSQQASWCPAFNQNDPIPYLQCINQESPPVVTGQVLVLIGYIGSFVAWLFGLIKTAQLRRWGWFVAILLLSPLASLIYGIAGPDYRKM